jgi:Ca2+-transporting ATPase
MNPFSNLYIWGAVAISLLLFLSAIYWPFLQKLIGTTGLLAKDWLTVLIFAVINLFFIEAVKFYYSRRKI